uniref:LY6/PLAUR domain containing 6B n=1 Tax=Esox lucius TaxID=8010 RepID=A0AAY5L7E1_ESOLU
MSFTNVVHVLVLLAVCDQVTADSINFYNVKPPVEATPFPKSFKCFTCERASDNYNCNRWAEDKWCPQDTQFCMTVHHFTSHAKTVFVAKRCAAVEQCLASGCRHHRDTGHTVSTSSRTRHTHTIHSKPSAVVCLNQLKHICQYCCPCVRNFPSLNPLPLLVFLPLAGVRFVL